ncbi:MAG TPA: hypothetical protein DEA28_02955 [Firmicutes bacterium]|nr:hypothetical protein [Bacillota bacterium]
MKDTKKIKNIIDWAVQIIAICAIIILLLNESGVINIGGEGKNEILSYIALIAGVFCVIYNFLYLFLHSTKYASAIEKEDKKK